MKKFFTLLFCSLIFCAINAQGLYQFEDAGFEGTWEGNEPIGWSSFSTANANQLSSVIRGTAKDLAPKPSKVAGYYSNSAVQIYSKEAKIWGIGANANGNITTGIINMGSTTPTNSANYNYTATNNDEFNMLFAGRPDAAVFYAKFTSGGSPNGRATFILHDEVNYRDPEISSQAGNRVGKAQVDIPASSDWQYYKADFKYDRDTPAKQYMLASITTNPTPGGSKNDYLVFDDVYFLYYSTLSALSYPGASINFKEDTYYYDLSSVAYEAGKLSYTKKGAGATVSESFDEEMQKLTITVRGNDYSVDKSNEHVYTLQFRSAEVEPVYNVTAVSDNAVYGNAKVVKGENNEYTFTATPNDGYIFVNWTNNGQVVSSDNPYTVTVSADMALVANFAVAPTYNVIVASSANGSAVVNKGAGNEYTFSATPNDGYVFANWTNNGEVVSSENPYTCAVTSDILLIANFVKEGTLPTPGPEPGPDPTPGTSVYYVNTKANNDNYGTAVLSGGEDNKYTFTATANEGYEFRFWASAGKEYSTENPCTVTVTSDILLVACFAPKKVAPEPVVKWYRIKDTARNEYMNIFSYNESDETKTKGLVNVAPYDKDSDEQLFAMEDAGNGYYYLVSKNGYYVTTAEWNVNVSPSEKSQLIFEETTFNGAEAYIIRDPSKPSNKNYFKASPAMIDDNTYGYEYYVYCDAPDADKAVWVLEGVVEEPVDPVTGDYEYIDGNISHADRHFDSFTITDGRNELSVEGIQPTAGSEAFANRTNLVFETSPGATIRFSQFNWSGEWMHAYAYIDYNKDGIFDTTVNSKGEGEGELVSYNYYNGTTSLGDAADSQFANRLEYGASKGLPEFTIPNYLFDGNYRMRIKIDWENIDPNGSDDIKSLGGCQCDIIIKLTEVIDTPVDNVEVSDGENTIYDLSGRKLTEITEPGIYIVNGVKMLVK